MIEWNEEFKNNIRENDFVNWIQLAKFSLHVPDKQQRYFDFAWKTRDTTIPEEELIAEFTSLMDEVYLAAAGEITGNNPGKFNLENYLTYLSMMAIFGSGHLDSHNLIFVPEKVVIYKLEGMTMENRSDIIAKLSKLKGIKNISLVSSKNYIEY